MRIKKLFIAGVLVLITIVAALFVSGTMNAAGSDESTLKAACLKATIQAIGMEIKNYEMKIEAARKGPGDPANIPGFEKRIKELQADLEKYRAMKPENYTLPGKKTISVTVKQPYKEGSLLDNDDMSRSGPFYHIAGVWDDDYGFFKTGQKYTVMIYFVYKRDYPFPDDYVFVDAGPTISLSQRQTGEAILEELVIKPNTISIRVASGGCTDKKSFRVDVKKETGISEKTPNYIITFYRIRLYDCKAMLWDGVVLTYDIKKDLGINGACTISVANKVSSNNTGK